MQSMKKIFSIVPKFFVKPYPKQKLFLSGSMFFIGSTNILLNQFYEMRIKNDIKEGEIREVQVGPKKEDTVLVVKVEGQLHCVSSSCPHFGVNLANGVLFGDKLKCPAHNAAFNVKDGAHEEGPMMTGLQKYQVVVEGDEIVLKVDKDLLNQPRTVNMSRKTNDSTNYVIIGGGAAGLSAAESLRQGGFQGKITILTAENELPYDRTTLSKGLYFFNREKVTFRNKDFLDSYDIEVQTNQKVEHVNYDSNEVVTQQGQRIKYSKLLIATGGSPRVPPIPGVNLNGVYTLRNISDAEAIRDKSKEAKKIVIVGASFIGMETAAAIKKQLKEGVEITVVDMTQPFERALGKQVGLAFKQLHEQNGIQFIQAGISSIYGDGKVKSVSLDNGKSLDADLVVLGTGMQPNTQIFGEGLRIASNGGIETDVFLKTSRPDVYAAGDCASFPYWATGESVRIEHHNEAIQQGYVAAMNMLNRPTAMDSVPFFWTRQFDQGLQYSGVAQKYDEIIINGNVQEQKFIAYYAKNGMIVASASMGIPRAQNIISEALRLNILPPAEFFRSNQVKLEDIAKEIQQRSRQCNCKRAQNCKNNL